MATLKSHVYFIQNILNKGVPSDDSRLSNRLVAHALKQSRIKLLKQKLDNTLMISETNYQLLCVPLELDTYDDCGCITDNECLVLKSVGEIPAYLSGKMRSSLQVKLLNGKMVPQSSVTSNLLSEYSLTNANKLSFTVEGNKVIILNNKKLKRVILKAIWEDPDEVDSYNSSNCDESENNCAEYMSEEFPIDSELVYPMYQLTIDLLGYSYKFPEDTRNDGKAVEVVQAIDPNEQR